MSFRDCPGVQWQHSPTMKDIASGNFAAFPTQLWPPEALRVVDWNIDRGLALPRIIDFLHAQRADVLTLQEVDLNARRTHFLNVAEVLARKLRLNYVFGREFQELTQGTRSSPAFHGQATLSRWPLTNARVIRFRYQSRFWRPRWYLPNKEPFQERTGGRIALVTEIDVLGRALTVYNLHLESRGNDDLRLAQFKEVLEDAANWAPRRQVLVAGDLNFDVSEERTGLIARSGLHNVLGQSHLYTRPARGLFGNARFIDWAFVSGRVEATLGRVHATGKASDHYPISFTLRFT